MKKSAVTRAQNRAKKAKLLSEAEKHEAEALKRGRTTPEGLEAHAKAVSARYEASRLKTRRRRTGGLFG